MTLQPTWHLLTFQSTPPVKAATLVYATSQVRAVFQSTPPVKAATLAQIHIKNVSRISIHAAREGGDELKHCSFNVDVVISIHAAREGGDLFACFVLPHVHDFNPRRP